MFSDCPGCATVGFNQRVFVGGSAGLELVTTGFDETMGVSVDDSVVGMADEAAEPDISTLALLKAVGLARSPSDRTKSNKYMIKKTKKQQLIPSNMVVQP